MKVIDIVWSTDGYEVDLPTEMHIPSELVRQDVYEDDITDWLSDQTGWLIESWGDIVGD